MSKRIPITALFFFIAFFSKAQLSGTYTIGGTSPDYATITAAVSDLTTNGVSGPVIFNIRAGTYSGQISLGTITGASPTDTIVFQSEKSAAVTISYSSNETVRLNNTSYIRFYDLTITSSGSRAFYLYGCVNVTISDNTITSANTTSTSTNESCIHSQNCTNTTISNNTINNGSYGILFMGNTSSYRLGNEISNNTIQNFYTVGIYTRYQSGIIISSNEITSKTSGGYASQYGIQAYNCNNSTLISKNNIQNHGTSNNYGIYCYGCIAGSSSRNNIINNTISHQNAGSESFGIYLSGSQYVSLYFNSINITDGSYNLGCAFRGYNSNYLEIENNIFAVTKASTSSGYAIYSNYSITTCDYNNLYTTGSILAYYSGSSKPNLSAWQTTGKGANSVSAYPDFTSATDLHTTCSSCENAGTPITGITDDMDGQTRSTTTPDIGADEFVLFNGTYTIGGTNPDYATIADAVSDLTTYGILGAVTFNIRPGTYTEQNSIGAISGSSSSNTITFQAESSGVTIDYTPTSSDNYVFQLNGVDYITFQNLTITANGTGYGTIFDFKDGSDNITITNTTLNGVTGLSNADWRSVIYSNTSSSNNNITITNNTINNGSFGVFFDQVSGSWETSNSITNNTIDNYSALGIKVMNQDAIEIKSNQITSMQSGGHSYKYGLYLGYCKNVTDVSYNYIQNYGPQRNYGIYFYYGNGTSSLKLLVSNNQIINHNATSISYGIVLHNSDYIRTYYNSVNITDGGTTSNGVALYITGSSDYLELFNNIFANTKSNGGMAIYANPYYPTTISASNYNNLYALGTYLGYCNGYKTNLTLWKSASAKDANSVSVDPEFISTTNLHTYNSTLDGAATSVGISDDFYGNTRDASTPDIGAFEFSLNEWDGSFSTDWNTAANWSENEVPKANQMVSIASSPANQPIISSTPSDAVGGVTIEAGASLTVNTGAILSVEDNFRIESNATATGSFVNNGTLSLNTENSNAYVERYVSGGTSGIHGGIDHFISAPISNADFSDIFDADKGNYNVYHYIPGTGWDRVFNGPLAVGKGYIVAYDANKTLEFHGSLNDGNITTAISSTNDHWNLIGNPYPSSLSASSFIAENVSNSSRNWLQGTLYFWNQTSAFDGGDYASHNGSGGTASSNTTGTTPNGYIASGQAFFVKSGTGSSTTCNFNNSMRRTSNSQFFTADPSPVQRCWLNIQDQDGNYNEILVAYLEDATNGFDLLYDGEKLRGNPNLSFYSIIDGDDKDYIIQGRALFENTDIVKLGINSKKGGLYTFSLKDIENFSNETAFYLVDKLENKFIDLKDQLSYSVNLSTGDIRDRFELHIGKTNTSINAKESSNDITIYSSGNVLYLKSTSEKTMKGMLCIYDVNGKLMINEETSFAHLHSLPIDLSKGLYVVKFENEEFQKMGEILVD
jgi:hypothetical protein